jgi:lysyl oxidase/WD40 repeat protein
LHADLIYVNQAGVHAGRAPIAAASQPAVSPDGTWVAVRSIRDGNPELYAIRLRDRRAHRITFTALIAEGSPDWAPDGKRLVHEAGGGLAVTCLDRGRTRLLVHTGRSPSWARNRRWIAFERSGWIWIVGPSGVGLRKLRRGGSPAWSPDGRLLAYELDGEIYAGNRLLAKDGRLPSWSPGGKRVAFERNGSIWSVRADGSRIARLRGGSDPAWRSRPAVRELLPDLDQLAPTDVSVRQRGSRFLLGFTSSTVNRDAPLEVVASRPNTAVPVMTARQRVRLSSGGTRTARGVGLVRYRHADTHMHWHYLAFVRYELRLPDGRRVFRDRKSGFCLVDRHPPPNAPAAVFTGNCGQLDPLARSIREGISPGWTDRYPAYYHGQNLDVSGLPGGLYVLVQHVNPLLYLRESDYANNAASVLLRLSWKGGRPSIRVLRSCPDSDRCTHRVRAAQ